MIIIYRIGDGPHFIGKVLDKLCRKSEENNRVVMEIYRSNLSKEGRSKVDGKMGGIDKEERFAAFVLLFMHIRLPLCDIYGPVIYYWRGRIRSKVRGSTKS